MLETNPPRQLPLPDFLDQIDRPSYSPTPPSPANSTSIKLRSLSQAEIAKAQRIENQDRRNHPTFGHRGSPE